MTVLGFVLRLPCYSSYLILHVLNAPYKYYHSTVSAGISQCSRFLKNVQNFTYLQILTEIKVAIALTVFIIFTLSLKLT